MFTYRLCLQRHLRNSNIAIRSRSIINHPKAPLRNYTTVTTHSHEASEDIVIEPTKQTAGDRRSNVVPSNVRQPFLQPGGARSPQKPREAEDGGLTDGEIKRELEFLKDPLKIADEVRRRLRNIGGNNQDEASNQLNRIKQLVRAASKEMECVVSWNHIINHEFLKKRPNAALKAFNDMKKHAQKPDSYTYTIIFRGLADNTQNAPLALSHALSIYQSMQAENSTVKPNIAHTNAVLKVCSRAGDTDALFGIAASIPTRGLGSANNLTYTTILNAIRTSAVVVSPRKVSPERNMDVNRKATNNARRIWVDVINRWRKADIFIDEELVCAMGRVLLIGEKQDWDDILSLVEQTMTIPRLLPREGTAERNAIEPARQTTTGPQRLVQLLIRDSDESVEDPLHKSKYALEDDVFKRVSPPAVPKGQSGSYATPGTNTFDMVMSALANLNSKAAAKNYWDYFTQDCGLKPDTLILRQYLRILRLTRSSSDALEVIKSSPSEIYDGLVFRLALSTCVRDKNNPNVFSHAGQILDLMQQYIATPDARALCYYMDVALNSEPSKTTSEQNEANARSAKGRQLMRALDRLRPSFLELRSQLSYGDLDPNSDRAKFLEESKTFEYWQESLLFVRKMISAYDIIMNGNLVEREIYRELMKRRSVLAGYVTHQMKKLPPPTSAAGAKSTKPRGQKPMAKFRAIKQ